MKITVFPEEYTDKPDLRIVIEIQNLKYSFIVRKEKEKEQFSGNFGSNEISGLYKMLETFMHRPASLRPYYYDLDLEELEYLVKVMKGAKSARFPPDFEAALSRIREIIK